MSFFMPGITSGQDTLICYNGGFEDGFKYYFGSYANYRFGGNTCIPLDGNNNPSIWNISSLPSNRRFEIANKGVDPLVGISTVRFGNKSLKINSQFGHISDCNGDYDANKLYKRFKVTSTNRVFNLWYAVVLERPYGHVNSQPFFSISCDLAINSDICFDSPDLECTMNIQDCDYDPLKVLDWTCHTITIPESEIGNIATVEITVSDCGCGNHMAYAYIDGFCEACDEYSNSNAFLYDESINNLGFGISNKTCNGDTLTICGNYTLPMLCDTWRLYDFQIPNFIYYNLSIDTIHHTFCFDIPISNFQNINCKDLYVRLYFNKGIDTLPPVISNEIEICADDFIKFEIQVVTGSCQNNNTVNQMSDDYYYVQINLSDFDNDNWTMERELDDPYPGEAGKYIIKTGIGDGTINLGPLMIQEGGWTLTIRVRHCVYTYHINPPNYCSGCPTFRNAKIFNIECNYNNNTWSYKIFVPVPNNNPGSFSINNAGNYPYGVTHTIPVGSVGMDCIMIRLQDINVLECVSNFIVCPPKPCVNGNGCDIKAYLREIFCINNQFFFSLNVNSINNLCFRSVDGVNNPVCGTLPVNGQYGPFNNDVQLTLFVSNTTTCTCPTGNPPDCFKTIYIPQPDCNNLEFRVSDKDLGFEVSSELEVTPNPVQEDVIRINSKLKSTEIEIIDLNGKKIITAKFSSKFYEINMSLVPGVYLINYKDELGVVKVIKFIKL
ncbi:MAG: T9SS type A sorting domain-containing protein [Saprospiraceae bacterium]|nr:T9SS type A sorting domain-containing protein [Saprospiraceae bacterium]